MKFDHPRPLFITGFPKSGTTLLLSLLDGHADLCVFPKETKFFEFVWRRIREDRSRAVEEFFARTFLRSQFGMAETFETSVDKDSYLAALNRRWEASNFNDSAFLGAAVLAYSDVTAQSGKRWWVEKTPRTEKYVPLLSRWYPDMKMIYVKRDPRANYAALKTWRQTSGKSMGVPWFCHAWDASVAQGEKSSRYCPVLTLRYEDLVTDTTVCIEQICQFLEIPIHDAMLVPTLDGKSFSGNSIYGERFSGVSQSSLYRWRETLTTGEVRLIERLLERQMAKSGYATSLAFSSDDHESISFYSAYLSKRFYDFYNRLPDAGIRFCRRVKKGTLDLVKPVSNGKT